LNKTEEENNMESHGQLRSIYANARKVNQERYTLGSKKRLMKNIEKKFKTAMIGTLARCEEQLGFLWGHGIDAKFLTTEQKRYRDIWDNLRTEILNHCNSQLRASMEEMLQYTINWNQYKTDFIVKKDN
jgi:Mg2+ and Co2+ transporter CorA